MNNKRKYVALGTTAITSRFLWKSFTQWPEASDEIAYFQRWNKEWPNYIDALRQKNRKSGRENYRKNAVKYRESAREYRRKLAADPVKKAEHNRKLCERIKRRKAADPNFRLRWQMRGRILMSLIRGVAKAGRTTELVGCSIPELRKHIESLWLPGMSWENYGRGGWHIDHIVPCSAFDMTNPTEQMRCFHYSNVRPMWEKDNLSKGSELRLSEVKNKSLLQVEMPLN